jgi:hypothetical protein
MLAHKAEEEGQSLLSLWHVICLILLQHRYRRCRVHQIRPRPRQLRRYPLRRVYPP